MERIIRNAIKCDACGDEIESLYRHDFRECGCRRVFVDGGYSYLRRGYVKDGGPTYTDLSIFGDDGRDEDDGPESHSV